MKLRIAAAVALAAVALLAGCNKGASNNANGTNVNGNSNAKTTISPGGTTTTTTPTTTGTTSSATGSAATPTEAFKLYLDAVKRNDGAAVKSLFSQATIRMLEDRAAKRKKTFDEVFNEGFEDAKKDAQSEFEAGEEKINGDRATLEVKDVKRNRSIPLNFVREGGGWKLSFAEEESGSDEGGSEGGGDHDGGH